MAMKTVIKIVLLVIAAPLVAPSYAGEPFGTVLGSNYGVIAYSNGSTEHYSGDVNRVGG